MKNWLENHLHGHIEKFTDGQGKGRVNKVYFYRAWKRRSNRKGTGNKKESQDGNPEYHQALNLHLRTDTFSQQATNNCSPLTQMTMVE